MNICTKTIDSNGHQHQLEKDQLLSRILAQISDVIVAINLEQQIIYWNQAAEEYYGIKAEQAIGKSEQECYQYCWLNPEDEAIAQESLAILGYWKGENIQRKLTGEEIIFESAINVFKDETGQMIGKIIVSRDISDRCTTELSLRQYERIVATTADCMCLIDGNYTYRIANPAYLKLLKKTHSEVVGHLISEVLGADNFSQNIKNYLDQSLNGQLVDNQLWIEIPHIGKRYIRRTYTPCLDQQENVIGAVVSLQDLTHLKQTEEALAKEILRNKILFNISFDGIVILDHQGNVIETNHSFAQMIGYPLAETTKLNVADWDPQWRENSQKCANKSLKQQETYFHRQDGSLCHVEISGNWVEWEGEIIKFCIVRDISDRKRVEAVLQEREAFLRSVGDNLPRGFLYQVSRELDGSDRFYYLSAGVERETGLKIADILQNTGLLHSQILPEDLEYMNQKVVESLANMSIFDVQVRERSPNGKIRWLHLTSKPRRLEDGRVVWDGIRLDITNLKQTEEKLRQNQARLIEAQQVAHIGNWEYNPSNGKIFWTEELFRLFNRDPALLEPNFPEYIQLYHPEDQDKLQQAIAYTISTGESYKLTLRTVTPTGNMRYIEGIGRAELTTDKQVIRIYGTIQDVTERILAEQELWESQEHYKILVQNAPVGIFKTDTQGNCLYVNPRWLEMTGLSRSEALGKGWVRAIHPDDQKRIINECKNGTKQGSYWTMEYRFLKPNGKEIWVSGQVVPFRNNLGEIISYFGTVMDITVHKQAEESLYQGKEYYRSLITALAEGIVFQQADSEITDCNESAQRILGLSADQIMGRTSIDSIWKAIHEDGSQFLGENHPSMVTLRTGQPQANVVMGVHKPDGSLTWISINSQPLIQPGESQASGVVCSFSDITEKRKLTQELAQKTKLLDSFINCAPVGMAFLDDQLRFSLVNEALAEMNGISVAEHIGKTPGEILSDLKNQIEPIFTEVLQTGQPICDVEIHGKTRKYSSIDRTWLASYFPITFATDRHPSQLGIGMIIVEITERKQIEATLQESHRRWRSLLDNVQLIVIGLDRQGNIDYLNPFCEQLTEYTQAEVIGQSGFNLFVPSYLHLNFQANFEQSILKENNLNYRYPFLTKSGEERMVAWNNTVLRDISGEPIGMICIGEDITERYHLERMKGEFVAVVSHELRTPLTSMQAALSLLNEKIIDPNSAEGELTIEIATQGVDRLVRLVNDILDLERLESGKIRLEKCLCNLADLLNTAVAQMQDLANQSGIIFDVKYQSLSIYVDPDRLLQVLVNLLSNAIKFSPNGSTIWLSTQCQSFPDLHSDRSPNSLLFTIKDQGRGIPTSCLESIFERFQQVDASDSRQKGGTGLGLAICRNIIQQHGGKIWVESMIDKGSTFYFTIPIQELNSDDQ